MSFSQGFLVVSENICNGYRRSKSLQLREKSSVCAAFNASRCLHNARASVSSHASQDQDHRFGVLHYQPACSEKGSPVLLCLDPFTLFPSKMSNNYRSRATNPKIRGHLGIEPPDRTLLVGLSLLFSILFITCVSLSFVGARRDLLVFRGPLDSLTAEGGVSLDLTYFGFKLLIEYFFFQIVLIAENVDVDVDEPAVTISWTIVACGDSFALKDTYGVLGSKLCGIPAMPVNVFAN